MLYACDHGGASVRQYISENCDNGILSIIHRYMGPQATWKQMAYVKHFTGHQQVTIFRCP